MSEENKDAVAAELGESTEGESIGFSAATQSEIREKSSYAPRVVDNALTVDEIAEARKKTGIKSKSIS